MTESRAYLFAPTGLVPSPGSRPTNHADALRSRASLVDSFHGKPRLFVLTDIGNEPDDQMSLTRLLLYSNEVEIEGLVAVTSTWQKDKVSPEIIRQVLSNYGKVQSSLTKHAEGFPQVAYLSGLVKAGQPAYGMAAVGRDKMSAGALLFIEAAARNDPPPLYIAIWAGPTLSPRHYGRYGITVRLRR